ncbi:MAG: DUF1592 domain-containing protein, partial [Myxococcota bacterium]
MDSITPIPQTKSMLIQGARLASSLVGLALIVGLIGCGGTIGASDDGTGSADSNSTTPGGGDNNGGGIFNNTISNTTTPGGGSNGTTPGNTTWTGSDDPCPSDEQYFEERVWEPILSTRCVVCHTEGGVAGDTRMVLVPEDTSGWIAANLAALRAVSEVEFDGMPLLLVKPTGLHPDGHGGGPLVQNGGSQYDTLAVMAGRLRGELDACNDSINGDPPPGSDTTTCGQVPPGPRMLRRLSHRAYENTIQDLLGVQVEATQELTPDNVVHGFDNNARALKISALLADQYRDLAERVAEQANLGAILPCSVASGGASCARAFITSFGLKAFRRPLLDEDIARYMEIYNLVAIDDGFEEGIRWVLTAMLQSPHFLYRTEMGRLEEGMWRLTSWELASALSYMIWTTMPDEELRRVAASGELYQREVLEAQANRLLEHPRSLNTVQNFTLQWLGLDQLDKVTRDPELYPELTDDLRRQMAGETARLIGDVWSQGGTLGDLLNARHTFLTRQLAEHYGVPQGSGEADAQGYVRTDLTGTPYGGLLTQGSVTTTHALPTGSSPIHRGILVRSHLLCQELPPPPANLDTSPPPVDPNQSTRERYIQHSSDPACSGCHDMIDPIGFAFEHFDAIGRWRATDGPHTIDDTGWIGNTPNTNAEFHGIYEMSNVLASSPDVEACYVEQWLRFGYGTDDQIATECYIENLSTAVTADEGKLAAALLALTDSPHFIFRTGADTELDVPGAEILAPSDTIAARLLTGAIDYTDVW